MRFCLLILNLSFDIYVFELNLSFGKFCKSSRTKDSKAFSILCLFERVEPSLKLASLVTKRFNLSNVQFLVIFWLHNENSPQKWFLTVLPLLPLNKLQLFESDWNEQNEQSKESRQKIYQHTTRTISVSLHTSYYQHFW